VVVPTRDRPRPLARCLAALEAQRHVRPFEVLVVDDGSADAGAVVAAVAAAPRARLLRLGGAGPAAARNRGAREARGPRLLFTDDDCEPAPDWVARLSAALDAGADAACGWTENGLRGSRLAEASQAIADHLVATSFERRCGEPFGTSNNLACRRDVALAVAFDERYGAAGGEDRDWCARLAAAGLRLAFEPRALVAHRHELSARGFWCQHLAYGRGARRFRRNHPGAGAAEPAAFYADLVRRAFERGAAVGALVVAAQLPTAVGYGLEAMRGPGESHYA
jgi:glycosyltransferase involved in cell wall biosynthesis